MSEGDEPAPGDGAPPPDRTGRVVVVSVCLAVALACVGGVLLARADNPPPSTSTTTAASMPTDGATTTSANSTTVTAAPSNDVGTIVFDVVQGRTSRVFAIDLVDGGRHELASDLTNPSDPTADAVGDRVAVVADGDEGPGIYVRRVQREQFVRQPLPEGAHSPALSPDGRLLAFVSDAEGQEDVYLADLTSLSVIRLGASSADEFDPSWDPSGDRLVFVRHGSTDDVVVVARPDGTVEAEIRSPGRKRSPALSPAPLDGSLVVAYVGDGAGAGGADPETVDLSGESVRRTATPGVDVALTWTGDLALVAAVLDEGLVVIDGDGSQHTLEATHGATSAQWLGGTVAPDR